MRLQQEEAKEKAPYVRPRLRKIELATDEVLAKGCKTIGTTASNTPAPPCWFAMCSQQGS